MKKTIIITALLAISTYGFAQEVDKLIQQADVERVINTLAADDMQGRGTFTPGIEKAARFIEGEYKKIGLLPMEGSTGYRQNFTMTRIKAVQTLVNINGKPIARDSIFTSTSSPALNWSNNADVQIVKLGADKDFRKEYSGYLSSNKKMLVLVDVRFSAIFNRLRDVSVKGKIVAPGSKNTSDVVFVLGNHDDIKSFDVSYTGKSEELPFV